MHANRRHLSLELRNLQPGGVLGPRAAVISAIVALTATILTPLASFWITRQQIRATLVSANRQAWINALRDDLSELFEDLKWLFDSRRGTTVGDRSHKYLEEEGSLSYCSCLATRCSPPPSPPPPRHVPRHVHVHAPLPPSAPPCASPPAGAASPSACRYAPLGIARRTLRAASLGPAPSP
jgi:hypothetical protein